MMTRFVFTIMLAVLASSPSAASTDCTVPGDYDAAARPAPDDGPTGVRLHLFVVAIDGIYDTDQSFRADFFIRARWTDRRLAGLASERGLTSCEFRTSDIWNPDLTIFNRREAGLQLAPAVRVDDSGGADVLRRFQGSLRSPLNLRDFPLDRQALPITLVSLAYDRSELTLNLMDRNIESETGTELPGWRTIDSRHELGVIELAGSEGGREERSRLDYIVTVEREFGYYLWRAIAPLTFIVLMSWAVFWIEPENAGIQIALASTSILTLIAFLFSLNSLLPPISYLTRMDFFLFGSLVLVFIAFAESIVTATLARDGRTELSLRLDRGARFLFPLAFLLIHGIVWTLG